NSGEIHPKTFTWDAGTITGTGSTVIEANRQMTIAIGSTLLDNSTLVNLGGQITLEGSLTMSNDAVINNASASIDVVLDDGFARPTPRIRKGPGNPQILNTGTIKKTKGPGTATIEVPLTVNKGIVIQKSGTLKIPGVVPLQGKLQIDPATIEVDGAVSLPAYFFLTGSGDFISAALANAGEIDPGEVGTVGTFNIRGNYSQTGLLKMDLGGTTPGTTFDQFNIIGATGLPAPLNGGQAALGGTLTVSLINGFTPTPSNTF